MIFLFFLFLEQKVPPSFIRKPSETFEETEGKLVKIEARVAGSQPMIVNWYKDDKEIFTSDRYDITFKTNIAAMVIKSSSSSDSGTYTCKVTNEAGYASCQVLACITGAFFSGLHTFLILFPYFTLFKMLQI